MTPAQCRFLTDVLSWGRPRPPVDEQLVDDLHARLERGLAAHLVPGQRGSPSSAAPVVITAARLDRRVCDGWQRDPLPFVHDRANVRGALASRVLATDVVRAQDRSIGAVVEGVWREVASRDPGNPASRSAWLNRCPPAEAADLREELADLLASFREVWPPLPAAAVQPVAGRRQAVALAGGAVRLQAVPDLVLDSPLDDGRARAVVVGLRTGLPRGQRDRERLRFEALVVALARRRPPFRWVTYHVTEGRAEVEDLEVAHLRDAVDQVLATAGQLLEMGTVPRERLEAGPWCRFCARLDACPVAKEMRAGAART